MVVKAVAKDGLAWQYASATLRADQRVIVKAVARDGLAVQRLP